MVLPNVTAMSHTLPARFIVTCLVGLITALSTTQCQDEKEGTGNIEGIVTVSSIDDATEDIFRGRLLNRYSSHALHGGEPAQPYQLSEKIVVYIEEIEEMRADQNQLPRPKLNQYQMMFHPLVLAITTGTTVEFPNNDNLYHNVFSYSHAREFDLGRYPTGQKKSITFEKTGIVKVYCDIHSYMYSTILVLRNHYFAVPNDDGSYRIMGVPKGTHSLVFWYGRRIVHMKQVTIKAGTSTKVDFSY